MNDNSQTWNKPEHWLFVQQQGGGQAQTSSNGSYSPHSSTSDLSSSSHGSYHWAHGSAPFDGSSVSPWVGPHPSISHNSTTIGLPNGPAGQYPASHNEHGTHHVGCHPMGTACQYCVILHQFQESSWRHLNEMEPRDLGTGRSVLFILLAEFPDPKGGRIYGCRICEETFARADRAITHLRHKHLDHRPHACQGRCGLPGCEQRFHSQENLAPHVNPKTIDCRYCNHKCLRQNIKRHVQRYHLDQIEAQPKLV